MKKSTVKVIHPSGFFPSIFKFSTRILVFKCMSFRLHFPLIFPNKSKNIFQWAISWRYALDTEFRLLLTNQALLFPGAAVTCVRCGFASVQWLFFCSSIVIHWCHCKQFSMFGAGNAYLPLCLFWISALAFWKLYIYKSTVHLLIQSANKKCRSGFLEVWQISLLRKGKVLFSEMTPYGR